MVAALAAGRTIEELMIPEDGGNLPEPKNTKPGRRAGARKK